MPLALVTLIASNTSAATLPSSLMQLSGSVLESQTIRRPTGHTPPNMTGAKLSTILPRITSFGPRVLAHEFWPTSFGPQVLAHKFWPTIWITSFGSRVLDHEFWITSSGSRVLDHEFCMLAELNNLGLMAGDVGNAYLEAYTKEKVCFTAGPEFGT
jgi:hypothetical protein